MARLIVVSLCVASIIFTVPALAANAQRGGQLAHNWCTRCHQIAPGQPRPATKAPAFVDIPRRTALDELQLALYLTLEKSRRMVGRDIMLGDATDLAAYIMSVRR